MAQSRDYRKPKNQEMRDLLVLLPHPVRVLDGAGHLLWQNQASERLQEEPSWEERPTTWQGQKATLATPVVAVPPTESQPLAQIAELEAENERLRKHQRDTARRKKKAEDSAKQTEKAAGDVEKREQKLRQQLETAERRVRELEASFKRVASSDELSVESTLEESFETESAQSQAKGKRKSKAKTKGKSKVKSKKGLTESQETLLTTSFEAELRLLEEAHASLRADLAALQSAESRWKEDKRKLESDKRSLQAERDQVATERDEFARLRPDHERLVESVAQLEEDKRQLEAWIEELEQAHASPGETPSDSSGGRVKATEAAQKQLQDAEQRNSELADQLAQESSRLAQLQKEFEAFQREAAEQESARVLEEQLAAKVREFEELERSFEEEQRALVAQKKELESRLTEQEDEFSRLRDTVRSPSPEPAAVPAIDLKEFDEVKGDLEEAKMALAESTRREIRLAERLESVNDLKEEQSKVLALVKDELTDLRNREKELRETLRLYGDFRQDLEQARSDAKKYRTEAEEARQASEKLESRLIESRRELAEARSAGPLSKGLSLRDGSGAVDGASATVKSQLELAQSRLRDTEKQLDETREALKKAKGEAASAKDTEKLAFQDTLTGLPNRHIVDRYLDFSHKQAKAGNRAYTLFLIDIDGFRVLNETFGREWGDLLLKAVGERLAGMRGANHVFARHSQDRFLLLAADLARPAAEKFVDDASRSLLGALAHPFEVKGEQIKLTGSIGIAMGPGSADDPRDMFAHAEMALGSAKARGIGSYFLHNEALQQKAQRDATYLRQMEHAITRNEFCAVYQPIFNLNKGMVTGLELLLRWNHRDQRTLRPEDFLEVALRSGMIFAIADTIWPKAFKALARWRRLRPGVTLSINLSDRELLNPKLVERATTMAKAAGVEPSSILFEVRDASRLRMSGNWWAVLGALHEAGFGLTLDDYGSESSLFGTLAYSGFRQAKVAIDEKHPVLSPAPNATKGVLYGAKRLQTRFDQKALKKAGFDLAQGLAVARPIDEDDVDGVLGK